MLWVGNYYWLDVIKLICWKTNHFWKILHFLGIINLDSLTLWKSLGFNKSWKVLRWRPLDNTKHHIVSFRHFNRLRKWRKYLPDGSLCFLLVARVFMISMIFRFPGFWILPKVGTVPSKQIGIANHENFTEGFLTFAEFAKFMR